MDCDGRVGKKAEKGHDRTAKDPSRGFRTTGTWPRLRIPFENYLSDHDKTNRIISSCFES